MAKKESTFLNMVLTLLIITVISALALGGVFKLTEEPIRLAKEAEEKAAIKAVIPDFDSLKIFRAWPVGEDKKKDSLTFYQGTKDGRVVGTAVLSYSNKGYDPTQIQVMVGFLPDGEIVNSEVLQQKETPGLGTKMETTEFRDQFNGKNPAAFILKVKKDGGDVDAITAATISSRAYCDALERAYQTYENTEGGNK